MGTAISTGDNEVKYNVHIKWQCIATVDADSQDDAINYVLHSAMRPKLSETSAVPVVSGKAWMHATAEKQPDNAYQSRLTAKALPRWKQDWQMRRAGKSLLDIGRKLVVSEGSASILVANYEEYLLNQKTKKAA